jgi:hypothetical protein
MPDAEGSLSIATARPAAPAGSGTNVMPGLSDRTEAMLFGVLTGIDTLRQIHIESATAPPVGKL